jgi:hypothetical protein
VAADQEPAEAEPVTADASERANELFQQLLKRAPRGFATSSMGKFDDFRKWLADELNLGDWRTKTYAVGSAGIAHNFGSRWAQNNTISGSHVPLGLAFLSIPEDADEDKLVATAENTNRKFVDGSKPTSFEAIITFVQSLGDPDLHPHSIMALPDSAVAAGLLELFPDLPVTTVDWKRGQLPTGTEALPQKADEVVEQPMQPELIGSLIASLETANYMAPEGLAERVVSSLAAKPFLILAGLSGSGKTLLGIMISHWFSLAAEQVQVVAVGADWTTTHHLVGYPDALDHNRYVRTPTLDLLLRAANNPSLPHFLVLDEMNLSHVERYFSDFLSAMESAQPISLHGSDGARDGIAPRVDFPRNLFILGTINVDETTYMFSPKVLDRANVIEFTVTPAAMEAYLGGSGIFDPAAILGAGAAYGPALVEFREGEAALANLAEHEPFARSEIQALFVALDRAGMQFGFRTAGEITRYLVANRQLLGSSWTLLRALDAQISQRILPKLSGDAARLRPILTAVLAFCSTAMSGAAPEQDVISAAAEELLQAAPEVIQARCVELAASFPITADKVGRMLRRLEAHGFTTAVEA